ncbi:hypothetical protein E3U43_005216 [Larimichthys crocea]|uniref:Uncharacterized protein n=1 Tax=Larimichthys crocea TaxID=215358 RepID=A0ACD3QFI8_LARCR|nr:hypothetical protein E3U43_005216 [Larimichthys crocea]
MWSQQAGTTNNSCPYRTSNMVLHAILSNKHQTSNWETSAVRQAFSFQQPAIGKTNNDYHKMLHSNLQSSCTNTQNGNPLLLDTNGHQVATQQDFHPNSGFFKANTTYSQPGKAGHWNQQDIVQTHSRQNIHNQNHRQNGTHHGHSPTNPAPSYNMAAPQSFRNNKITTNSSNEQIFHSSSTAWKTQQYPYHLNSNHNTHSHLNSNHNNTHCVLSKTNNATQEQIHRNQVVARIADELRKSCTASSDGCPPVYTSSSRRENQFFSECRMTEPNQNMQSVTMTVSQSHNSNASQSLSLNSGLTLPNTSHNFMLENQHSVDLPQQSSVSNVFYVPATVDGSGNGNKAANACVKSPNNVSQFTRMPENIPPQKKTEYKKTESKTANRDINLGVSGMLQFVTVIDDNIHSSPGRIATRAVAVVPPLSQEYYEGVSMHTSSNTINQSPPKDNLCKIQVQNKSTKYKEAQYYSAASSDSNCSAGPCQALSQKQLCSDDSGSKLGTSMQVDQCAASTAQQSVTSELPVSSSGHKDRSENQTDPKGPVSEVSAATPWTIGALTELVQDIEKTQMMLRGNSTVFDYSSRELLLSHFWDGNTKNLSCKLKTGWYKDLMDDVLEFCHKHVMPDSIILPQENASFRKEPQSDHVLKNDEVYSEPPYKSLWLNVNEDLDDIDKEFGFPWSLKHHLPVIEIHSQPEQSETINSNPAQLVDLGEEKQTSTVEATTTQAASPNKTESTDSSDPYYSFEIKVLPPEEARIIFEQTQSKMPQSMDKDSHPEKNSLVGVELPEAEDRDVTLNDSTVKNTTGRPIEQVCCISRWMEMICGSDNPDLSKCQCKNEQSLKDCTDKTPDKVEKATCSPSELCNEPSQIIDLTKNDHTSYSHSEPKNISQISGSKSSIVERKRKRSGSHESFFPLHKKSNKCNPPDNVNSQPSTDKKVLTDDTEPSSSNVKSIQLVLFGSAQDSRVNKRRHISSSATVSGVLMPPKYLSVNLSPLSRKLSETVPTKEYTVKRWIYEKWRRSLPPIKIQCRSKLKTQKCAFSSFSGVKNPKHRLSLTRRRSLPDNLKSGKEKTKMDVVPLEQPADKDSRNTKNGSHGGKPHQENSVLTFNVLPSTFNFKNRSNEGKEINGSFTNKTALDEGKDSSPNKPLTKERGNKHN